MRSANSQSRLDVTTIILTKNEAANVRAAIESVRDVSQSVWVVDSGSTDETIAIATASGAQVVHHEWPGFAAQRNWAIDHLPIESEWIFFLDADERATPSFIAELRGALRTAPAAVAGFSIRRVLVWLGSEVRFGGMNDAEIVRVFRRGRGRVDDRRVNEHVQLDGDERVLESPILHASETGVLRWARKHVEYARLESAALLDELLEPRRRRTTPQHESRITKRRLYAASPPFARAAARFAYRMTVQRGYRDGLVGGTYHVLHGLTYRMLIDAYFVRHIAVRFADKLAAAVRTTSD